MLEKIEMSNLFEKQYTINNFALQDKLDNFTDSDGMTYSICMNGCYSSFCGDINATFYLTKDHWTSGSRDIVSIMKMKSHILHFVNTRNVQVFAIPISVVHDYEKESKYSLWSISFRFFLRSTIQTKYPYISHLLNEFAPLSFTNSNKINASISSKNEDKHLNNKYRNFLFLKPKKLIPSEYLENITELFDMNEQLSLSRFIQLSTK